MTSLSPLNYTKAAVAAPAVVVDAVVAVVVVVVVAVVVSGSSGNSGSSSSSSRRRRGGGGGGGSGSSNRKHPTNELHFLYTFLTAHPFCSFLTVHACCPTRSYGPSLLPLTLSLRSKLELGSSEGVCGVGGAGMIV